LLRSHQYVVKGGDNWYTVAALQGIRNPSANNWAAARKTFGPYLPGLKKGQYIYIPAIDGKSSGPKGSPTGTSTGNAPAQASKGGGFSIRIDWSAVAQGAADAGQMILGAAAAAFGGVGLVVLGACDVTVVGTAACAAPTVAAAGMVVGGAAMAADGARKLSKDRGWWYNEARASGAADAGPPSARSINPGNLKNVDVRRVEKTTGLNPHEIKKEYLGDEAPIAKYDLKRDPASGYLVIVEKRSQSVVDVTHYVMGTR
jgi:hypothetical protein